MAPGKCFAFPEDAVFGTTWNTVDMVYVETVNIDPHGASDARRSTSRGNLHGNGREVRGHKYDYG
jgi:hypothetical protein